MKKKWNYHRCFNFYSYKDQYIQVSLIRTLWFLIKVIVRINETSILLEFCIFRGSSYSTYSIVVRNNPDKCLWIRFIICQCKEVQVLNDYISNVVVISSVVATGVYLWNAFSTTNEIIVISVVVFISNSGFYTELERSATLRDVLLICPAKKIQHIC